MNTHVKRGSLAVGAAVLLLGGAGTLAYWNSTDELPGGTLSSGELTIDAADCDDAEWLVSKDVEGVEDVPFDPAAERLVPGDEVSRTCSVVVDAEGTNLRSVLGVTGGGLGDTATIATDDVVVSSDFTRAGDELPQDEPVTLEDGDEIVSTVTVAVPLKAGTVDNDSMLKEVRLDEITLTATQATTAASAG